MFADQECWWINGPLGSNVGWRWAYIMGHERAALHLSTLCNKLEYLKKKCNKLEHPTLSKRKKLSSQAHEILYKLRDFFSSVWDLCYSRCICLGSKTSQPTYIIRDDGVMKSNHIQNFELVHPNIGPGLLKKIMKCVSGGGLVDEWCSNMTMGVLIPMKMFA
jgi:hypothetical protein